MIHMSDLGISNTKKNILTHLKRHDGGTIESICQELKITATAVRQHIHQLAERNLVISKAVRNGSSGRPKMIYIATDMAEQYFTKKYYFIASNILQEIQETCGKKQIQKILGRIGAKIGKNYYYRVKGKSLLERIAIVIEVLDEIGLFPELDNTNDDYFLIHNYNCIFFLLTQEHSGICEFHKNLLETLLDQKVTKTEGRFEGSFKCTFKTKKE